MPLKYFEKRPVGELATRINELENIRQFLTGTALSLERLSDILDTPPEVDKDNINNITMPPIQGHVKIEYLTFSFPGTNIDQLNHINAEFPAGQFVGIVGLSGLGKSTLMKLIPRLYQINSERIVIDKYDISKTELYSFRQQIGMVLQDTLLFSGTVQENIAHADTIVMMDKGQIVETGTHDRLMASKGLYYCLYQQQAA